MVQSIRPNFVGARVRGLPPSPTMAVAKAAQALRQQGVDVVDFGPGEPDFVTPQHIREAAIRALNAGLTHYPPSAGYPELREAIAEKLARENELQYDPTCEIVVTPGAKQAIAEVLFAALEDGDEVIVFDPGWSSHGAIVQLAGGRDVHVGLRADFGIDEERLRAAITTATRAIIIGTPSNPTGHVLTRTELEVLAELCRRHNLILISDEIYERITYSTVTMTSAATLPDMWERTITINGFSKAYAMTGWRLGYVAAPRDFAQAVLKVHEQTVTAATSFAQMGAIAALRGTQEPIREMIAAFATRRDLIVSALNALPGVSALEPDGAFYVFPDVRETGHTGTDLAQRFLQRGVAVTPGCGFGETCDTHMRLSFATSEERIATGLERMGQVLTEL